jgi:PadR family transcriptional regulator
MMPFMSDPLSKDLVAASSKPIVLSILARGENYGYAIIQEVRERSNGRLEWTEGMLYPVLHRLEQQKLIRARWVVVESGRKRKYYRLSRTGTQALAAEREQWMTVNGTLKALWG